MADTPEIILHHYDTSPFSEKIRLIFGLKKLRWGSVQISSIMPRPDLMPLTGGYRRTPVMQIGADIFCDTQVIIRQLDAMFPEPTLFPAGNNGIMWSVGMWTDRPFFSASVAVIFGGLGDSVPDDFIKDRETLSGQAFNIDGMKAAVPMMKDHWRAYADWINAQLADGRPWLMGDETGLADINAYMNIWFLRNGFPPAAGLLDEFPVVTTWADRIAKLGHGVRVEIESQTAVDIAKKCTSNVEPMLDANDPNGLKPGDKVSVMPDDYGRVPVMGELVSSSAQVVAIKRNDARVGDVVVHFPRAGFLVLPMND
jgi:glutathione S-transferase